MPLPGPARRVSQRCADPGPPRFIQRALPDSSPGNVRSHRAAVASCSQMFPGHEPVTGKRSAAPPRTAAIARSAGTSSQSTRLTEPLGEGRSQHEPQRFLRGPRTMMEHVRRTARPGARVARIEPQRQDPGWTPLVVTRGLRSDRHQPTCPSECAWLAEPTANFRRVFADLVRTHGVRGHLDRSACRRFVGRRPPGVAQGQTARATPPAVSFTGDAALAPSALLPSPAAAGRRTSRRGWGAVCRAGWTTAQGRGRTLARRSAAPAISRPGSGCPNSADR